MLQESQTVERERLEMAITTLEAQRSILGDQVVESSVIALRRQLAELLPRFVDRERRLVTVLFADVSGFTALAEEMDAEVVGEIINTLWQRLDAIITDHGGYIDKHFGDGVMALWGVRSSREDDPERAIRAALDMQSELIAFREDARKDLEMRIGINSGPVVLGQVGATAEFTAIGDTVNTADRLEKVAPVGTVLISHNTFQHVRGIFDVSPAESIAVRGKREPLQVYVVRRAKARSFHTRQRGVEGVETRMIGRVSESRRLYDLMQEVINRKERRAITIIGDAGIGKSRLLYEFENWVDLLETDVFLLRGRARQENQQIPFGLFLDVFSFRFDVREDDSISTVREKLEQGFSEVHGPVHPSMAPEEIEMRAHFVGHLLGYNLGSSAYLAPVLNDPKQIRDRATTYMLDYFQDAATSDPVLMMVEDLHLADDSSLDLLNVVAHRLARFPILILTSARPEFYDRRPNWFEIEHFKSRLNLKPLSLRENRTLVYEILKLAEDVPAAVGDLIVENSEGNPLYVEELIKMLIDEGAIIKGEESWKIRMEDLASLNVPPTLAGILQARIDVLDDLQKRILQQASVIGRVFWDSSLLYLNQFEQEQFTPSDIEEALDRLRERELIFRRSTSTFSQAAEYIFNHAILREVVYESVLLRHRSRYHSHIADWLRMGSGERSVEMVAMTADHLIRADRSSEALADLHLAGQQAAARFANEEARAYLTSALELVPVTDSKTRFKILSDREKVYHMLGNREKQKADLEKLEAIAYSMSPAEKAYVSLRIASFEEATSDYESMIVAARNAIAYVTEDGPPEILSRSHLEWGIALERLGRYQSAHEQLEKALSLAFEADDRSLAGMSLRGLGIVSRAMQRHEDSYRYYSEALTQFIELGDVNAQTSTQIWLGVLSTDMGDLARARAYYEEALDLTRETGFRYQESFALSNLGSNANYLGDYDRANRFIKQALVVAQEIDNRIVECLCLNNMGTVAINEGDYENAFLNYEQSLAIALDTGHRRMEASASTGVGHALVRLGDTTGAEASLDNAIRIRRELGEVHLYESLAILAYAFHLAGDRAQALEITEEILDYIASEGEFIVTEYGLRNYLYLLEILESVNDGRSAAVLDQAYAEFEKACDRIPDEATRRAFREDVPFNRQIIEKWQAVHAV